MTMSEITDEVKATRRDAKVILDTNVVVSALIQKVIR